MSESHFRRNREDGWTYLVRAADGTGPIKVGATLRSPWDRLKDLQASSPVVLEVIACVPGIRHERQLHELWSGDRLHGEWFAARILDDIPVELDA